MAEKKDKKPRRKVVLSYVEDRSKGAFSITVPTKWEAQPVAKLVEYWAKLWNDKNGATPLDAAALELVVEGKKVGGDEILREAVPHFVEAVAVRRRAAPSAAKPAPTLAPTPPAAAPPPDDARAQFRARAEARKKAGDDRFRKRDWAGAIEALTDARKAAVLAEETSMLESVALNLSLAHLQSGDAKKAEAEATGLLYRAPGHGKALFRRGVARMKRGDRPAAAADLEGALRAVASGPGAPSPAEVAQIERALAQCRRRPAAAAAPPVKKGFLAAPAKAAPLARPPRVRAVARGLIPLDVRDVEDLLAPLSDGYVAPAAPPKPKPADEGTARYVIVDGKIVDASQAAALRAAADAGGGGFGDSRAGAVLREDAELKLRELHGGMAVFGVQGAHNTAAKRDAHVRRAREDARRLAPALGAGHAHARFFEAFCAMTLDDGERQRAHDDAFARGERPAGLGPRSEAVFDAWRAAWAVYAAPETPESGSLHLKTQCMDFMTKCYLEAAPPRHLEAYDLARDAAERAAAGDAAPHVRAGVLAQALREATGDGRHARVAVGHFSAGLDADAASDDAALELMIALQNDFSDMDAARLCAERHIDGCAAARRACRWADAWQRPGVYSAPSLLRSAAAWPDPKLAETVVGAVAGAFPMIMEEVLELYGGRGGARKRDWPRAGASGSSSDGARARGRGPLRRRPVLARGRPRRPHRRRRRHGGRRGRVPADDRPAQLARRRPRGRGARRRRGRPLGAGAGHGAQAGHGRHEPAAHGPPLPPRAEDGPALRAPLRRPGPLGLVAALRGGRRAALRRLLRARGRARRRAGLRRPRRAERPVLPPAALAEPAPGRGPLRARGRPAPQDQDPVRLPRHGGRHPQRDPRGPRERAHVNFGTICCDCLQRDLTLKRQSSSRRRALRAALSVISRGAGRNRRELSLWSFAPPLRRP